MELDPELEEILTKMREGTTTTDDAALLRAIIETACGRLMTAHRQINIARALLYDTRPIEEEDALPRPSRPSDRL